MRVFERPLHALVRASLPNARLRYKKDDQAEVDPDYHPPRIGLKTDKVTTSELAKNDPPGDPNVTKVVQSNEVADIKDVLNALK